MSGILAASCGGSFSLRIRAQSVAIDSQLRVGLHYWLSHVQSFDRHEDLPCRSW